MKRIIFFSKNLNIGGMEKSLIVLLNELVKFYDVTIVLEENIGILKHNLDKKIKIREYKVSKCNNVLIRKIINAIKRFIWFIKNKNRYDFSCNYATYSIIGSRLAQIASKNNYLYVHSDYTKVYSTNKETLAFFDSHKIKRFKGLIFVSNEAKNNFKEIINYQKTYVINNLIDYENILRLSNEELTDVEIDNKTISLLFVGRLDNTSKNFKLLLSGFSKSNNNSKLYLIGDGEYKQEIVNIVKKLGIEKRVALLGQKINPYPYMKKCDCIILTSKYEGFPVIYTEALVLNKKVITTIPVSDDNIDIRDYFVCINQNKNAVTTAINNIVKSEKINYNINYKNINKKIIKNIIRLIEEV